MFGRYEGEMGEARLSSRNPVKTLAVGDIFCFASRRGARADVAHAENDEAAVLARCARTGCADNVMNWREQPKKVFARHPVGDGILICASRTSLASSAPMSWRRRPNS